MTATLAIAVLFATCAFTTPIAAAEESPPSLVKPLPFLVPGKARRLEPGEEAPDQAEEESEQETTEQGQVDADAIKPPLAKPEPFLVPGKARKRGPGEEDPEEDPTTSQQAIGAGLPSPQTFKITIERERGAPTTTTPNIFAVEPPSPQTFKITIERGKDVTTTGEPTPDKHEIVKTELDNVEQIQGFQAFDRANVETLEAINNPSQGVNAGQQVTGGGGAATPFMEVADCSGVSAGTATVTINRLSNGQVQVSHFARNGTLFGTTVMLGPFAQDMVINLMIEVVDQIGAAGQAPGDQLTMTIVQNVTLTFSVPSGGNMANITTFTCSAPMQVAQ